MVTKVKRKIRREIAHSDDENERGKPDETLGESNKVSSKRSNSSSNITRPTNTKSRSLEKINSSLKQGDRNRSIPNSKTRTRKKKRSIAKSGTGNDHHDKHSQRSSSSINSGLEKEAKKRCISSKRTRKKSPSKADTLEHQDGKEEESDNDVSKECHADEEEIEDVTVEKSPPSVNCFNSSKTKLHRLLYEAFKLWQFDRLDDASDLWKRVVKRAEEKREFKESNDGILEVETKEDGMLLPLHLAISQSAPYYVVKAIVKAFPEACQVPLPDQMLPLRTACGYPLKHLLKNDDYMGNDSEPPDLCHNPEWEKVIIMLMKFYPKAISTNEIGDDTTALHLLLEHKPSLHLVKKIVRHHEMVASEQCSVNDKNFRSILQIRDCQDQIPLHVALEYRASEEVLQFLIDGFERGTTYFRKLHDNCTPLHLATCFGSTRNIMQTLVELFPFALEKKNSKYEENGVKYGYETPLHLIFNMEHRKEWIGDDSDNCDDSDILSGEAMCKLLLHCYANHSEVRRKGKDVKKLLRLKNNKGHNVIMAAKECAQHLMVPERLIRFLEKVDNGTHRFDEQLQTSKNDRAESVGNSRVSRVPPNSARSDLKEETTPVISKAPNDSTTHRFDKQLQTSINDRAESVDDSRGSPVASTSACNDFKEETSPAISNNSSTHQLDEQLQTSKNDRAESMDDSRGSRVAPTSVFSDLKEETTPVISSAANDSTTPRLDEQLQTSTNDRAESVGNPRGSRVASNSALNDLKEETNPVISNAANDSSTPRLDEQLQTSKNDRAESVGNPRGSPLNDLKEETTPVISNVANNSSTTTPSALQNQDSLSHNNFSQDDRLCIICEDNPKSMVFLPCAHLSTCKDCFDTNYKDQQVLTCPMCRGDATETLFIYA